MPTHRDDHGPNDWNDLRADALATADRIALQISTVTDLDRPIPEMEWTVSELAKHVLSLPALYLSMHDSATPLALPADVGAYNRSLFETSRWINTETRFVDHS